MTILQAESNDSNPNYDYRDLQWQLIILGLYRFSEALAWTTIFPYVFFMMQSFVAEGPDRNAQAAAYASLNVALFTFGQFVMGIVWAKVSDRLGRKPTLMIGVVGGSVSALAFGFSTNIWVALGARLLGGLVDSSVVVVSTCVGELVKRKEHQGKGFSVVPFLRGLGTMIGPVIGGQLADPVKNLPSIFRKGAVWETFPYLLPNLIVVLCIMASGFLGFFFLEESHPQIQLQPDLGRRISAWISGEIKSLFGNKGRRNYAALAAEDDAITLHSQYEPEDEESLKKNSDDFDHSDKPSLELLISPDSARSKTSPYTWRVIFQITVASLLAFHKVSSDVIIPTFLATSPATDSEDFKDVTFFKFKVGFDMTPPSIANILLTQAVIAILSQALIVPRVIDRFGPLKTIRWTLFVFPWLYCITPFTARLPYPLSIMAILLDLWVKGMLVSLGYVASAILLISATPAPEYLATVNGASVSIGCLARSAGAAVSGSMFHAGLASGYIGLPFWTLSIVAAAGALLSLFLD